MGFPRQEYWGGLPSPEDLADPGIEPVSPALAGEFFTTERQGEPVILPLSLSFLTCTIYNFQDPFYLIYISCFLCILSVCIL